MQMNKKNVPPAFFIVRNSHNQEHRIKCTMKFFLTSKSSVIVRHEKKEGEAHPPSFSPFSRRSVAELLFFFYLLKHPFHQSGAVFGDVRVGSKSRSREH